MDLIYPITWYQTFDEPTSRFDEIKKVLEFDAFREFADEVIRGKSLDIGTATGRYLLAALDMNFDAQGIDYNDNAICSAKNNLYKNNYELCRVSKMDARRLKFKNGSFHLVTCMMATIVHTQDYRMILREVSRVLHPEGAFIFSIWNTRSPLFGSFLSGNSFLENRYLEQICHEMHQIENILDQAGLDINRRTELINSCEHQYLRCEGSTEAELQRQWVSLDKECRNQSRLPAGELIVYRCKVR